MAQSPVDNTMKRGTQDRPDDALERDPRPLRERGTSRSEDAAAGSVTSPISPGEAQPGDMNEQASNLGGPVDVFPLKRHPPRETTEG